MTRGLLVRVLASVAALALLLVVALRLLDGTLAATGTPPRLVADAPGPLFDGVRMTPGVEREACIGLRPDGAPARGLAFGGRARGALAGALRLRVQRGASAAPPGSCAGFVPERDVYDGPLAGLAGTELAVPDDPVPTAEGGRVAYRLTARLAPGAPADAVAGADFRWAATFDDAAPPSGGGDPPAPAPGPTPVRPAPSAPDAVADGGAARAPACVVRRRGPTVAVRRRGRARIEIRTVGTRYLPEGALLPVVVRVRGAAAPRVTLGGRTLRVRRSAGAWRLLLPSATTAGRVVALAAQVRVGGRSLRARLPLGVTRCGTTLDARRVGRRGLAVRIDGREALRGVRVDLPRGLGAPLRDRASVLVFGVDRDGAVFRRDGRARARGGRLPAVRIRGGRLEVSALPPGTSIVRVLLAYPAGREGALRRGVCRLTVRASVSAGAELSRRSGRVQRGGRRCAA